MNDATGAARDELLRAGDQSELSDLRARLRDAEEALDGIRSGEVDAVVVKGPLGQQIYTVANADRTYRLLIEQMKEGAVTILNTGLIGYCNNAFAALLGKSAAQVSGSRFQQHLLQSDVALFDNLLSNEDGGRAVVSLLSPTAAEIPVNVSLSPLPGNTEAAQHVNRACYSARALRQCCEWMGGGRMGGGRRFPTVGLGRQVELSSLNLPLGVHRQPAAY